jgi:23S rRNA pseudouridine1911/1915/1917 synthase
MVMALIDSIDIDDWTCIEQKVTKENSGQRLDQYLSNTIRVEGHTCSRAMFQQLILDENVLVQGKLRKNNYRLRDEDFIEVFIPPAIPTELVPEQVSFEIIFEDHDIVVISKPPDLVVHPAAGNMTGTLVHGLLYHCKDLTGIKGTLRPGIVHRLDKDTSGLMVVAKNDVAQQSLVEQFKERKVKKIYLAIVDGVPQTESGTISTLLGRHPVDRKRMAVTNYSGKEAITHWKRIEVFDGLSMLEITLETGRTHQIRVHMAHLGYPIVGDAVYGLRKKMSLYESMGVKRQCLHSFRMSFYHPSQKIRMVFEAPMYHDMAEFVTRLRPPDA